jgi:hypothetical protein
MPTARGCGVATSVNGKIYAIGGTNAAGVILSTVEEYDPATDTWTTKANMPTARFALGVVTANNGKIYAIGGVNSLAVEEYDPATNTWIIKANMTVSRWSIGIAASGNGKIYVIGGQGRGGEMAEYDPGTDTWAMKASMPLGERILAAGATSNAGKIYAIGGHTSAGVLATVEEYTPAEPVPTYSISGKVTLSGNASGLAGVLISAANGHSATTDVSGNYSLLDMGVGTYTLTPSKAGYTFTPSTRQVTLGPDATTQDFTATIAPPAAFAKTSPANAATGITISPTLGWVASSGATSYEYCYDTSNDAACGGAWISAGTSTSANLTGLNNNTIYYWQVRAVNAGGAVYASDGTWWSFTTTAATSVILAINPATKSVSLNQNFDLVIEVRSGTQSVDGAAAYLNFNPAYLRVVSIRPGSDLPTVLQNNFDNTTGQVNFSAGTLSNFPQGTFTLATITFNPIVPVSGTPVTFASTVLRKSDVTYAGASIFSATVNASVEITNMASINGGVTLQGRPAAPDARWSVPLNVSLTIPGNGQPSYSFTPTTDNSGRFTVTGMALGTYEVRIKHSHTLQTMKTVTLAVGVNTIDFGMLLEGDANNDNYVTLVDFSVLATAYAKCQGTIGYDSRADFNGDTCVTLLDFSLLATNYGKGGVSLDPVLFEVPAHTDKTGEAITISVDPITNQVQVGKTFTVTIRVQSGVASIDGAQASLDFDPTKLRVKKMTGNTTALPHVLLNTYDNSTGRLDYASGTLSNFPAGDIVLVQIEFEALSATNSTSLTFHYGVPRDTEVTFAGGNILTGDVDGTILITDLHKTFLPVMAR